MKHTGPGFLNELKALSAAILQTPEMSRAICAFRQDETLQKP